MVMKPPDFMGVQFEVGFMNPPDFMAVKFAVGFMNPHDFMLVKFRVGFMNPPDFTGGQSIKKNSDILFPSSPMMSRAVQYHSCPLEQG